MSNAFLTGGSSGIGQEIAQYLKSIAMLVDSPTRDELNLFDNLSYTDLSRYDYLFLCAGVDRNGRIPFIEQSEGDIIETMTVNTIANMRLINRYIKQRHGKWSKIVVIGSTIVEHVWPNFVTYGTSKVALECFIDSLSQELNSKNIGFTQIHPGLTKTNFNKNRGNVDKDKSTELYDHTPHMTTSDLLPIIKSVIEDRAHLITKVTVSK